MRIILFLLILANSIYPQERRFLFRDPVIQSSDAFTMLGDSRTQYVFQFGVEVDWENQDFLGKYKTSCSEGKTGIQNAGVAGSTTEHWLEFLKSEYYRPEEFHEKIVLMIGGNDIQRYSYKWKGFRINRAESFNEAIDEIHARVVEIVNILKQSNKKIILQTHFRVNPDMKDAHSKALNEGLDALNLRLLNSYGSDNSDVSLAFLTPDFPAPLFLDLVHLNPFGYQLHSYFLSRELQRRCWW
ncbi:MAG TPA: SGNH/GDSL hydrolase family protein [Leptospiraceae bacterium]|nr:SGNH/GDSL hydrolase family protein [Leptospiraceae bacterium]